MQKQDTANPKQKNTTRKQKYKSQNRNKHLKAETRTKNTKLNHKTKREFKNTNHIWSKTPKQKQGNNGKTIVSHDSSSFNYLNPRSGGFFYREGMITGYNSPFPSSKNYRFKNEAKGTVKRATNCCRTSPKAMLRVLSPINQTRLVANKIQCCKLYKYWLLIG